MTNYKTSWVQRLIDGAWQKTFAFAHAKTVYTDYANKKTLAGKLSEIDTEIGNKANKTEIPTELPANGGNADTVNGHTVNSDVPANAVFTDTKYDYSALLGYDIYNLVSLKDATYPANKTWLSKDFIAPFDGYIFFMVQTDGTSGEFSQVFKEDNVLVSDNQRSIADFNTWGEAYYYKISKGKTYHFDSYTNTATAFNKVMLCIRKKFEIPTEYIPYAPSNVVLAEETTNLDKRISDNGYGEIAGGKSLIPDEDMNNLLSKMNDNAEGTTHSYANGVLTVNRTANVNSGVYVYSSIFKRFDNKKIKISFDAKCSVTGMVLSIFLNNSAYSYTPILTSEYKRYSVEVVAGDTAYNFIIYGNAVAGEVNIKNVMFSEAVYNDTSYESYFPSNKMLAGDVAEKAPKENPVFAGSVTVGSRLSGTNFGQNSFTNGDTTQARGNNSFATGDHPISLGANSQSLGCYTLAKANQCAIGHFNSSSSDDSAMYGTTGTAFYIGNGDERTRSNAFRVDYDGTPYSKAGLNTTGADYAEFFEWEDGNENNEDRRGYFVTLVGKKINIAKEGDWILGIVSGFPAIIGNGDEEWKGRYVFDDFGCPVIEEFEYEEEISEVITNEDGEEEVITKKVKRTGTKWKEVPEYDPERPYVQRSERKEWSAVGMLGVLSVRDDGSCKVNGFCKLADGGIATASDTGYRVVKRVTDNIVEVIFK